MPLLASAIIWLLFIGGAGSILVALFITSLSLLFFPGMAAIIGAFVVSAHFDQARRPPAAAKPPKPDGCDHCDCK